MIVVSLGSLIASFLNKGAYHFRNRIMKGGPGGCGDVINPAQAVFNVSIFLLELCLKSYFCIICPKFKTSDLQIQIW